MQSALWPQGAKVVSENPREQPRHAGAPEAPADQLAACTKCTPGPAAVPGDGAGQPRPAAAAAATAGCGGDGVSGASAPQLPWKSTCSGFGRVLMSFAEGLNGAGFV